MSRKNLIVTLAQDCHEPEIEKRFSIFRKTFVLTNEDIEVLTYFYLTQTSEIMKDCYAELLKRDNCIEISPWCVDYLSCLCDEDLTREFSAKGNDEVLEVSDFDIHEDNLLVLDALFKVSGRQNILLYGAAGTGKTSFARSLAKRYNKVLYGEVS